MLSTLFEAFELRDRDLAREITDLVVGMEPGTLQAMLRLLPLIRDGKGTGENE